MKLRPLAGVTALCIQIVASRTLTERNAHPIVSVIDLLKELRTKVAAEGAAEASTYTAFETWCQSSTTELQRAVAKEKTEIERLQTVIDGKTREEELLTNYIAKLGDEIIKATNMGTNADTVREAAAAAYATADGELDTTTTAIGDAIAAVEGAKPAALVQTMLGQIASFPLVLEQLSSNDLAMLKHANKNATDVDKKPWKAPDSNKEGLRDDILAKRSYDENTNKYAFKSGSVVDLLKKLERKFKDDKEAATKAETAAINEYTLAKDARKAAIETATTSKSTKESLLGTVQEELVAAKTDLGNVQADLKADSDTLSATESECSLKAREWKERSDLRTREMEAIKAGIRILSAVAGVRHEQPTSSPLKPFEGAAFLQVDDPRSKVVNLLREEAHKVHSRSFDQFTSKIAKVLKDEQGPFDMVLGMIQKMIWRLNQEQHDEDEHKAWCDVELSKTNISKTDKESRIEKYDAKLTADKATVELLVSDIDALNLKVSEMNTWITEATDVREASKKENEAAIDDAQKAQAALAQAQAAITAFYKDSGAVAKESWEFLQKGRGSEPVQLPEQPSAWDASYTGVADPQNQPGGIITVLQTIASDFSKMEADTKAQEELDQRAFEKEMQRIQIEKARQEKESEIKTHEKARLGDLIQATEKARDHVNDELGAVNQYLKDLEPACVNGTSTYEERKGERSAEIDALKQSKVILEEAQAGTSTSGASFLAPIKPA